MKLAKKMLACAMALAMVAALALTAFAAAPVVTMTATEYTAVGDEVTVTVSATGMTGLMSAGFTFTYDEEALEFVKVAKAEGAKYDMGAGDKVGTGEVTWTFIFLEEADADSDLCVLTFKVKKADATVALRIDEWEGTDAPAEASVVIKQKEVPTTAEPTTVAPTTEAPTTAAPTTVAPTTEVGSEEPTTGDIPQTGEAGVAAIAGVMALAAVAFVATRKKDEE